MAGLLAMVAGCQPSPGEPVASPQRAEQAVRASASALPPRFERYSVASGLSSGHVRALLQDRQGFLWVATYDGLNRFDGATFTEYHHDPGDAGSLGHDITHTLFEARDGRIWIGHDGGVDRFDPQTETFTHFRHDSTDAGSLGTGSVYAIAEDAAGRLWLGQNNGGGLSRYDSATDAFVHLSSDAAPGHLRSASVYGLLAGPDGTLWVGGGGGMDRLDTRTGVSTPVVLDPGAEARGDRLLVWTLTRDRAGALWIGTYAHGLYRLDGRTGAVRHFPADAAVAGALGHPWVLSILEDAAGTLWVGTDGGGLHRYDPASGTFERIVNEPSDPSSLSEDRVLAVLEDRTGVLWVGTGGGLNRRLPLSTVARQTRHRPGDAASLGSNDVTAFTEDAAGVLYVGTDGAGLSRRDPASGAFARVDLDADDPASLGDPSVLALGTDAAGAVWVGTYTAVYRQRAGRFAPFRPTVADTLSFIETATAFAAAPTGRLWIGSQRGLFDVDARTGTAVRLGTAQLTTDNILSLVLGAGGALDVGTFYSGVDRFDPATGTFATLRHDPGDANTISSNYVTALHHDARGALWAGTNSGLDRVVGRGAATVVTHYGRADGLPSAYVNGIAEDDAGRLWVATNRGVSRLDPATGAVRSYSARDGLQSDVSNEHAVYQSPRTGTVYVGGDGGFDAFDPDAMPDEPPPGPVVLTGLRLGDTRAAVGAPGSPLAQPLSATRRLRLGPSDAVVTFTFAALDFGAPGQHRYAVRLAGLHDEWLDVGSRREATFAALPPGHYTLQVRAAGRDGVWGEPSAPLAVVVAPPWWRAWWALALYALAALGLGVAAVRVRDGQQRLARQAAAERRDAAALRELDRSKSAFFANVSHEFRTPLTLTLGPLDDVLAGEYGPVPPDAAVPLALARRSAGRVLDLIGQILDLSRLEAGHTPLRARPLDLAAVARAQADAFAPLAAHRHIALTVGAPDAPVEVWADPEHLGTVLSNVLSNALKFTPDGGCVRIAVALGRAEARVSVHDTGPGIPAADLPHVFDRFYQVGHAAGRPLGSGIGLALASDLARLHGGTLSAESTPGGPDGGPSGSTFTLALPLGRAHLEPHQIDGAPDVPPPAPPAAPTAADLVPDAQPSDAQTPDDRADDDRTTVLVADDNADIRAYVRRHLEAAGYRVDEAEDGQDALARVRERLPDLVVSDVMMPRLDGLGLCRALRADPETDFVPILLLTAKAAPENRLDGLAEACDDYLTKPFDVREVVARVGNLIALRQRLRDRYAAGAPLSRPPDRPASADDAFVAAVRDAVEARLGDDAFDVAALAAALGQSRSTLNRRTRDLLGTAPSDLLRTARLDRAVQLLDARAGSVSEVAYAVGFKSVAHFSNAFLAHTGRRPSASADRSA